MIIILYAYFLRLLKVKSVRRKSTAYKEYYDLLGKAIYTTAPKKILR